MKPVLVIYNPAAGRGRARELWQAVEHALHDADINFEVAATSAPLQATALAQQAQRSFPLKRFEVIRVDPDRLRSYGMGPDEVIRAVTTGNVIMPAGSVMRGGSQVTFLSYRKRYRLTRRSHA